MKNEDNQIGKAPLFNGNFDIWKVRMRNFLIAKYFEVFESVITKNTMQEESKEYNARARKANLSGLPDAIKAKVEKCSSTKGMWDKLQGLHSKGSLTMTSSQEDDGKKEGNPKPIKEVGNKNDDIKLEIRMMTSMQNK